MSSQGSMVYGGSDGTREGNAPSPAHPVDTIIVKDGGASVSSRASQEGSDSGKGTDPFANLLVMVKDTTSTGRSHLRATKRKEKVDANYARVKESKTKEKQVSGVVMECPTTKKRRFQQAKQESAVQSTTTAASFLVERSRNMLSSRPAQSASPTPRIAKAKSIVGTRPSHWLVQQQPTATAARATKQNLLQMTLLGPQLPSTTFSTPQKASTGTTTSFAPFFVVSAAAVAAHIDEDPTEATTSGTPTASLHMSMFSPSPNSKKNAGALARQLKQLRDQERADRLRLQSRQCTPLNNPRAGKTTIYLEILDDGVDHPHIRSCRSFYARATNDLNPCRVDFSTETVRHHQLSQGSIVTLYGSVSIKMIREEVIICTQLCETGDPSGSISKIS